MSYTNDEELLNEPLLDTVKQLERLEKPIRARLENHTEWNEEHLAELETLLNDVVTMQGRLRRFARSVR